MGSSALTLRPFVKFRDPQHFREVTALAAALALLLLVYVLGAPAWQALRYERAAIAAGDWWRLASGHLVHEDLRHLVLNLAGLVALWSLYVRDARLRDWAAIAVASALGVGLGLYFGEPQLAWYVGLSGVLHGLWAAGGVAAWKRWPLESLVTLALLGAKLAFEGWHGALTPDLGDGLPVITAAHRCGALAGLLAALALGLRRTPL
jgi:rhomboid family GlyGly-CTERM serine protease